MHILLIGEGQIGRTVARHATAAGDTVTILRRTAVDPEVSARRYGPSAARIDRVVGDLLDRSALQRAARDADAVLACFHVAYDARIWRSELPPRELAVLDLAASRGLPVVFPESMYAFQGQAARVIEGAPPSPRDPKGEVRAQLLGARRAHRARTVSVVASDLIGAPCVRTGAAVASATVIEPIAAGRRPVVVADPGAPHSFTAVDDLAASMLHAARHAERLTGAERDVVLHAPTAPPSSLSEIARTTAEQLGRRPRSPLAVPLPLVRAAGAVSTMMRELGRLEGLWYGPCVLAPGLLSTQEGLEPTDWSQTMTASIRAAATGPSGPPAPQEPRSGAGLSGDAMG